MTGVLILAYCQLTIIEQMACQGTDRDTATRNAWNLYYQRLLPLDSPSLPSLSVLSRGQKALRDPTFRYGCLSATSRHLIAELRRVPQTDLSDAQLGRLLWLLETTRRVSEGQEVLAAARAAHDAHLGKPRQRRRPVQRDWLGAEAVAALDGLWPVLVARLRRVQGRRPSGGAFALPLARADLTVFQGPRPKGGDAP